LSLQEGLAVGVPFLCFEGVGSSGEFNEGVFTAPKGDDEFIKKLKYILDNNIHKEYWNLDKMKLLRSQVEPFTWTKFVEKHDKIWNSII
jgi:hypothetical protein